MELVKELPPEGKGGNPRVDWDAVAARLKARPGEWGVLHDVSRSMATQIMRGRVAALRPGKDWEASTRRDPNLPATRATLYLRYVGAK
jgi:hypothetical protein